MTPAPAGMNRRSATITTNIPSHQEPPPSLHGLPAGHAPRSSISSQSVAGPPSTVSTSFTPPRASFSSSSRPSPVVHSKSIKSGSEQQRGDRDDAWTDNAWRSIFDAALVKAQQAVQLDELQETSLAASLYAQAAHDLGRVIPMCTSEKKKQSMTAIQAIYLDRVSQLKESATTAQIASVDNSNSNNSHDPRHSVSVGRNTVGVEGGHQLQQQQYQQQVHQLQQQQFHQQLHLQQQQQIQQQQQQMQLQQQQHQTESSEKGFRLFGKKRSKTQPSSPQPPMFMQTSQGMHYDSYHLNGNGTSYNNRHENGTNGYLHSPILGPQQHQRQRSQPLSGPVSPAIMPTHRTNDPSTPVSVQAAEQLNDMLEALDGPVRPATETSATTNSNNNASTKSSKWRPFGKKKSKSVSVNMEKSLSNNNVFVNDSGVDANIHHPVPETQAQTQPQPQEQDQQKHISQKQQQQQQDEDEEQGYSDIKPASKISPPSEGNNAAGQGDTHPQQQESLDDNGVDNRYLDDEDDEDVDPYYIADTKGRAQVFEGSNSKSTSEKKTKVSNNKEPMPSVRRTTSHSPSSYSQEHSFSPTLSPATTFTPTSVPYEQEFGHEEPPHSTVELKEEEKEEERDVNQQELNMSHEEEQGQQHPEINSNEAGLTNKLQGEDSAKEEQPATQEEALDQEVQPSIESEKVKLDQDAVQEKSKSKRTWYGKKKKDKEEDEKAAERKLRLKEREKEKTREMARLIDEALFGGPVKRVNKNPQVATPVDSEVTTNHTKDDDESQFFGDHGSAADGVSHHRYDESNISSIYTPATESLHESEISDLKKSVSTPQLQSPKEEEKTIEASENVHTAEAESTVAPKRSRSRHFSIFKSKKKSMEPLSQQLEEGQSEEQPSEQLSQEQQQKPLGKEQGQQLSQDGEGQTLSRIVTIDDNKSVLSQSTHKSSVHGAERQAVAEMARPKESAKKKRMSDEYEPYQYREEVEGPLMERVPVPENREVVGFVLPVQEIVNYNATNDEEAAAENWDSWVSQLESFEKVLSDKGLDKELTKKEKKDSVIMGSTKNNRSSIFGVSRSDTVRSRASSMADLHALESRPVSMSTTLMDDASISHRHSFQSSRSGASEPGPQSMLQPPVKKRWWKRKETPSMYRVSNALSMGDLDQQDHHHLSSLLQSHGQVRSSEDLTLENRTMSMPINFDTPTPASAPVTLFESKAKVATVVDSVAPLEHEAETVIVSSVNDPTPANEEVVPKGVPVTTNESEKTSDDQVATEPTPMAKVKKSSKPKLLPISTPLQQLLKLENPEELWRYVQQAKTYATSRMNKGDKRSAAIALKRGQALEARWQEVLLEMASSDDTDEILEDDEDEDEDDTEETEEPSEEEVVAVVTSKKSKTKAETTKAESKSRSQTLPRVEVTPVEMVSTRNKDIVDEPSLTTSTTSITSNTTTTTTSTSTSTIINLPTPSPSPPASVTMAVKNTQVEEDEEEEDEVQNYAAVRRQSISRSNSTPDKYSKYKVNKKSALKSPATDADASVSNSTASSKPETSVDDGRLARNGSKFAALEGMKNVKILQQHLEVLEAPPAPSPTQMLPTVTETIKEEDEEE
ncbi:hypothetical protein BGZ94_002038 [Podila epigama]|nr:hypothetical protein BGZ94_002038 [Podila epigama]